MNGKPQNRQRTNQLFEMFKSIHERKRRECAKGEEMKQQKELSCCTFTPKIKEFDHTVFNNNYSSISLVSNYDYITKMKKIREDRIKRELHLSNKLEKTSRVTIPQEFVFHQSHHKKNEDNSDSSSIKQRTNINLSDICQFYQTNEINDNMSYKNAKKYLHNLLNQKE